MTAKKRRKSDEPILIRLRRELLKPLTLFVSRRSKFGRMLRTRGCKKLPSSNFLQQAIERAVAIVDGFDPHIDVLFIGSSHIQKNIAPAAFQTLRGWNAGVSSGDLKISSEIYKALRQKWPKGEGQYVVLGQDFWLPMTQAEYTYEYFQTTILHELLGISYRSSWLMHHAEKTCRRIINQVRHIESWNSQLKFRGLMPMESETKAIPQEKVQARVQGHLKLLTFEPTELKWLQELKNKVAEDGRTLILLRPPHREDYLNALNQSPQRDLLWTKFGTAAEGLPVIDAFQFPLPPESWNDMDHLSESGATLFSRALEPVLLKLREQIDKNTFCKDFGKIILMSEDCSSPHLTTP